MSKVLSVSASLPSTSFVSVSTSFSSKNLSGSISPAVATRSVSTSSTAAGPRIVVPTKQAKKLAIGKSSLQLLDW